MQTKRETKELYDRIAELGGKAIKEDDIVYEGIKLVVPIQWKGRLNKAIEFIQAKQAEDDEMAVFNRTFKYRPWDGAVNAYKAMKEAFGMVRGLPGGFFTAPPTYIQVPISVTETEEVPWGRFAVPLIEGATFHFNADTDADYGMCFRVQVQSPRKHRFAIEGLFKLMEKAMQEGSIYKGKAIDGQTQPTFLDLGGVDPEKIIYSEQVLADLEACIWGVMRYEGAQKKLGMSLKRAILLEGTFGTGKTLAAFLTAQEAVRAGWTFLMARPGRDNFLEVLQTAKLYQPACVFFEDADQLTTAENTDQISQILDQFDGVQAKNTKMMVVMTTNHPEVIHKGMLRPGRIDSEIVIGHLDASGIERLIRCSIPTDKLEADVDFTRVVTACKGYVPAFVKEVADLSMRYALVRAKGDTDAILIGTDDLVHAAGNMRPQFDRMNAAPEGAAQRKSLEELLEGSAKKAVAELAAVEEGDGVHASVWDAEKLTVFQNGGTH